MKVPRKVFVLMHGVPLYWWFNAWWFATDVMAAMLVVYDKRIFNHRNCWHLPAWVGDIVCRIPRDWLQTKDSILKYPGRSCRVYYQRLLALHKFKMADRDQNEHFRFNISLTCACLHPLHRFNLPVSTHVFSWKYWLILTLRSYKTAV